MRSAEAAGIESWPERRSGRRYQIRLALNWEQDDDSRTRRAGRGETIDFSRGGILFESGRELGIGEAVRLSISWPFLLGETVSLQLIVMGEVVRVQPGLAAVRMLRHEFRTTASRERRRGE